MTTPVDTPAAEGASEPTEEDERDDDSHNSEGSAASSPQSPQEQPVEEQLVVAEKHVPLGGWTREEN